MSILRHITDRFKKMLPRPKSNKLVLTILVKDEADIIVDNVFYHYAKGVDAIIVTDNGSTDGTLEILREMHKDGLVYLLQEQEYQQTKWVNKMGVIARKRLSATAVIHTDADEFWHPKLNNLKEAFLNTGKTAALAERFNVLPDRTCINDDFPQARMNLITKRLETGNLQDSSKKTSMYLFKQSPKVMFSVRDKIRLVKKGNHQLEDESVSDTLEDIEVFHFPFKSAKRFQEKVIRASDSITQVDEIRKNKNTSWHWKRWCQQLETGKLQDEIDLLIPELSTVGGVRFRAFDYQREIIAPILADERLSPMYSIYRQKPHL